MSSSHSPFDLVRVRVVCRSCLRLPIARRQCRSFLQRSCACRQRQPPFVALPAPHSKSAISNIRQGTVALSAATFRPRDRLPLVCKCLPACTRPPDANVLPASLSSSTRAVVMPTMLTTRCTTSASVAMTC
jgi:hypothetical protein